MTPFHTHISKMFYKKSLYFLFIAFIFWNCSKESRNDIVRPLNDSTTIEKVMDRFDLKGQYLDGVFWIMKDMGAIIQVYRNGAKLKEITLSNIRYGDRHFYILGGGFSTGFLLDKERMICFQHTPNQLKTFDLQIGDLQQIREVNLPLRGNLSYIDLIERENALIQIRDPEKPKQLILGSFDIEKNNTKIILNKEFDFNAEDVLIKVFGSSIFVIPQQNLKLLVFDLNTGDLLSEIALPAVSDREYKNRPKFESENAFQWLDLTAKEKREFKEDKYVDFYVDEGLVYLVHLIYSREEEDSHSFGFYWSEIDLVKGKPIEGRYLEDHFINFDGHGNYFLLKGNPLQVFIRPMDKSDKVSE